MRFSSGHLRTAKFGAAALAMIASAVAAPLSAQGLTGYNVFTFGSFTQANTEVNGRLAVGGAMSNTNSSVGVSLPAGYNGPGLVVGGALNWNGGQLFHGDAYVAGARSGNLNPAVLKPQATTLPVDFVAEQSRLTALSNSYSALTSTGSATNLYGTLYFYGNSTGANVINVTQAQLTSANGYKFYAPTGGSLIVNVLGVTGGQFFANTGFDFCTGVVDPTNFTGCGQGDNNSPPDLVSKLLWNVNTPSFTSINFAGSMRGSFLGPQIGLTATYGSCIGDFVVATANSNCEFYNETYDGYVTTTSVVPEPASVTLMLAGLAGVGFAARRRKSRTV